MDSGIQGISSSASSEKMSEREIVFLLLFFSCVNVNYMTVVWVFFGVSINSAHACDCLCVGTEMFRFFQLDDDETPGNPRKEAE